MPTTLRLRRPADLLILDRNPLRSRPAAAQFDKTALLRSLAYCFERQHLVLGAHQDHVLGDETPGRVLGASLPLDVFDGFDEVHL
jgi:hypothetical protein